MGSYPNSMKRIQGATQQATMLIQIAMARIIFNVNRLEARARVYS